MTDTNTDLLKRIASLEAKLNPKPGPTQALYDPTANMSMPRSVMREMARASAGFGELAAPRDAEPYQPKSPQRKASRGNGWIAERLLDPLPAGTRWVDQQLDAQDARDRGRR